jgi:hypothetical protein
MPLNKKIFLTEEEKFAIAMNRTHSERFRLLMKLIRVNNMLKSAKIIEKNA